MAATRNSRRNRSADTAPEETVVEETVVVEDNPTEVSETENENVSFVEEETVPEYPEAFAENPLVLSIAQKYKGIVNEISEYNKKVLAEKDSEWNASKLLKKALEMASPEDANDINENVKTAHAEFERIAAEYANARQNLISVTANELGVSLSTVAEQRDEAAEAPLKEKRATAVTIVKQLQAMTEVYNDDNFKNAVATFLSNNGLPAIGRDQVRSFNESGTAGTPKYRVSITITNKDGEVLMDGEGFSKTAIALSKPVFGYERGKKPSSDTLRETWEKLGGPNSSEDISFEDNELTYTVHKK